MSAADESPAAAPEFTVNLCGATPSSSCSQLNPSRNALVPELPHNLAKLPLKTARDGGKVSFTFPALTCNSSSHCNRRARLSCYLSASVLRVIAFCVPNPPLDEETDSICIFHLATSSQCTQSCSRQSPSKQEWSENIDISSFIIQEVRAETKYAGSEAG